MSFIEILKEDYLWEDEDNLSNVESSNLEPINKEFVTRLMKFLDSKFPDYAVFNDSLGAEIRKYIDISDTKKVTRTKMKIHDILEKEHKKFLDRVLIKIEKLKVPQKPKTEETV